MAINLTQVPGFNPDAYKKYSLTPPGSSPFVNPVAAAISPIKPLSNTDVGSSLIPTGQDYIKYLTDSGRPSTELDIKNNYYSSGLNNRFGDWRGSTEQYNAMKLSDQTQAKIVQTQQELVIAQEDLATKQSEERLAKIREEQDLAGGNVGGNAIDPLEAARRNLGSTDMGDIINEITSGTFATPEGTVDKAANDLAIEDQKAKYTDALSTLQEQLAARGLTFSGIRTKTEEGLAAQNLRAMTGLSLDLASKIISSARKEQTRRENAYNQIQTLQNNALEAMGYVINPITGKLAKTLAREKAEEPKLAKAPTVIGTESTGYFQWDGEKWVSTGIKGTDKTMGFTDQEKRKLQQAGLSGATYQEQLDYLYGGTILSQTFLNKAAVAGVPNDVAIYIQTSLNNGAGLEEVRQDLNNQLGDWALANKYLDAYIPLMQKASTDDLISIIQGLIQ